MASDAEAPWILHYWDGFPGRGEFVRLIFEEVGVPYQDKHDTCEEYFHGGKCRFGDVPGIFPQFAPPMLQKGDFYLSSTPTVCKYVAKKFGLLPDSEELEFRADQINNAIHDYIAEGRLVFHGKNFTASYYIQQEETKPYIEWFVSGRIENWLKHFEAVLRSNNGGKGFVIGDKITYVDLALLHVLRATEVNFPEAWKAASTSYAKLLSEFKDRMSERPKLKAYLASERCRKFCGNSMM